jgi:hypothetical protein
MQKQKEEEKINYNRAPLISNMLSQSSNGGYMGESEYGYPGGGEFLETGAESTRISCVKLSQIIENSLFLEIEALC